MMCRILTFLCIIGASSLVCGIQPAIASGDGLSAEEAVFSRVRHGGAIESLGDNPFGEVFHAKTGQLNFRQVDISLKGAGPEIEIARTFSGAGKVDIGSTGRGFYADWDLDLPRITTLVPSNRNYHISGKPVSSGVGGPWRVAGADPTKVCSNFGKPLPAAVNIWFKLEPEEWWEGVQLKVGGKTSEVLSNTEPRKAFGESIRLVTKDGWAITCLPKTANGEPGEAFLAISPDGTRYWMDWPEYQMTQSTQMPTRWDAETSEVGSVLERDIAMYLPSKIQDRFGNILTFKYASHRLVSIEANDGRKVELSWMNANAAVIDARAGTGFIDKISVIGRDGNRRTWSYGYQVVSRPATALRKGLAYNKYYLTSVTLPDGRAWNISLYPVQNVNYKNKGDGACDYGRGDFPSSITASMKHPSGLSVSYDYARTWFMRAGLPEHCLYAITEEYGEFVNYMPNPYWLVSLTTKTISGPGISTPLVTRYNYIGASSLSRNSDERNASPQVSTEITLPGGAVDRYSYVNTWGVSEGDLLSVERKSATNGPTMRKETFTYATGKEGLFSERAGIYPMPWTLSNTAQIETNRPLKVKEMQQDGQSYVWRVDAFNNLALPTLTSRYNFSIGTAPSYTPGSSLRERFEYYSNPDRWIMGVPSATYNADTGEAISSSLIDQVTGMVKKRYSFGLLKANYEWDAQGNLVSVSDAVGNTTTLGNYALGIPRLITYPDKSTKITEIDGFGQIISHTDQLGATRSYSYNDAGWLLSETQPAGDGSGSSTTKYAYDYSNGQLRSTRTVGGLVETTLYDAFLRAVENNRSIPGTTITRAYRYDWEDRVVFSSYPTPVNTVGASGLTNGVTTTYDALGRVTIVNEDSELGKLVTKTVYLSGNRKQVTDPRGYVVTSAYQAFDKPDYHAPLEVIWPESQQVVKRDAYGNPLKITQSGMESGSQLSATRDFEYDAHKRLCRYQEPESGATISEYDSAGNLRAVSQGQPLGSGCQSGLTESGKVVNQYDAMHRVVQVNYPGEKEPAMFTYDALGNLKSAANDGSVWQYTRNKRGLLTNEILTINNRSYPMSYGYVADGSLASISYPNGLRVDYQPDGFGRATKVGNLVSNIKYLPNGQIETLNYANGVQYSVRQNLRQLVSQLTLRSSQGALYDVSYSYDNSGNLVSAADANAGGKRGKNLKYDGHSRLIMASQPGVWGSETYRYDALNNLRSIDQVGSSRVFDYSSNNQLHTARLNGVIDQTFEHDARGNITNLRGNSLKFNSANQLVWYAGLERYRYDGLGNRFARIDIPSGANTFYGYNSAGKLMFEVDEQSGKTRNYIFLNNMLIAQDAD